MDTVSYLHAKERLKKRYDLDLSYLTYLQLSYQISNKSPNVTFLGHQNHKRTVWAIDYESKRLITVYHQGRGIVTFLPPNIENAHGMVVVPGAMGVEGSLDQEFEDVDWPVVGVKNI